MFSDLLQATQQFADEGEWQGMSWLLVVILLLLLSYALYQNRRLRKDLIAHSETEQELSHSKFLLQEVQQMAHLGNWELDPITMQAIWSDEVFRTFGMKPNKDVGPNCLATILHPDDKEAVLDSLHRAIQDGRKHHMEYRIIRENDGELRWLDCHAEHIWGDNGNLLKLRGVIQDITERKNNELKLQEREQQVRELLDYTSEAIFGLDMQGNCTFANPACLSFLGYQKAEQIIGKNMHELVHHSKSDGSSYPEEQCPIYHAFVSNSGSHVDNEVFWKADGSSFQVEYWSYPILRNNQVNGAVVAFTDISDRLITEKAIHDSEERYRTIFEGAPEGVWLIGPNRCTIEVNKRLCDLIGYSKEEMVGKKPIDFTDEENTKIFIAQTGKIETTNRREYEIALRHKDGHNIPTYFRANTIHTSTGDVLEAVAFVTDLSEQKIAEKALRRAQKMDALGQLTGGIAHDFNNILSIILGNLSLLKNLVKYDEKASKRVQTIDKSARRAADLTKQLLGFSRRQAAKVAVTNINHVINDMKALLERSITPKVNLHHHFADELWLTKIDPGDFEDALLNLVFNARDAMESGGNLTLETGNEILDERYCSQNPGAVPGEYVQLVVSDNGHGISNKQQEHIFDPFYTTKAQGKGTGLGLPMVYGFVKRSQGYIKVYSEIGIGTTFRIYLPRAEGQLQETEKSTELDQKLPRGSESILVVDDEEDLLELAEESLLSLGYSVYCAANAHQALTQLSEHPDIELLFSDVVMPGGMSGFELAEKAIELKPKLKVILTSGFTGKALAQNGQCRFKADMLDKPYTQADLAYRIREIFGNREIKTNKKPHDKKTNIFFKTGIDDIDDDHQQIFDLLRQCGELQLQDPSREQILSVLDDLNRFTLWHFPREEAIMEACGYPGVENHRQVHQMLIKQLKKLRIQFNQQGLTCKELYLFMNDWIYEHIQSMDNSFVSYCSGKSELIAQVLKGLDFPDGEDGNS